ncbi:macro domain-containing protein [Candidatus Laterigemmans baculatus]|uniref:macro domain-containing protein n=1 Tax=Candidatus Laterigemmans baculatus TaxID=2770505 RepID=UPI0013DD6B99|nr:macro domain-containing protein [Candidatus Laterigemmans baculatus]
MLRWEVAHSDLLDASAAGLLCSANPNLNLSGGVGGAFSLRFGGAMQSFLHEYLRSNGLRHIEPGNAVVAPSCGSPFAAVAHAVAIDAFYDTTTDLVLRTYDSAIRVLADRGCSTIAAACLGCGYGRMSDADFAVVAEELFTRSYPGVERVTLMTTNAHLFEAIRKIAADAGA